MILNLSYYLVSLRNVIGQSEVMATQKCPVMNNKLRLRALLAVMQQQAQPQHSTAVEALQLTSRAINQIECPTARAGR
jgi:hypothetical protein